jgi:hypothetical protein
MIIMYLRGLNILCHYLISVAITEEDIVMVHSKERTGPTKYLMLHMRCHINQCCYNWVWLESLVQ